MQRLGFLAGAGALLAGAMCAPALAAPGTAELDLTLGELRQIAETLRHKSVLRIWRPPSEFPEFAPLAVLRGHTDGEGLPILLWINVDHRELMTPRASHAEDEDPIVAAMIVGELARHPDVPAWKHLFDQMRSLPVSTAHDVATMLARLMRQKFPVVTAPHVSDAEFASEAFPFEVVRYMTPGIRGVEVDNSPPGTPMPKDAPLLAYVGRTDPRHPGTPVVWGDAKTKPPNPPTPEFLELYVRTFILATADMQPPTSAEKRAYDDARAQDERAGPGVYAARYAFAEPFRPRVRALMSRL